MQVVSGSISRFRYRIFPVGMGDRAECEAGRGHSTGGASGLALEWSSSMALRALTCDRRSLAVNRGAPCDSGATAALWMYRGEC